MYEIDLETVQAALATLWHLAVGAWRLDPDVFEAVLLQPGGATAATLILLLAGISLTLGQSVVLFANRVPRRRFLGSLLLSALVIAGSVMLLAGFIWLAATIFLQAKAPLIHVYAVAALSYAPFLFGFLLLIPYLGNILAYGLRIWLILALITGITVAFDFSLLEAILASALGWLIIELLLRIPALGLGRLRDWTWRVRTGARTEYDAEEAVDRYLQESGEEFATDESLPEEDPAG